ncbi:hypothetical protein BAE44_0022700 [Dichanthelium oligosanthes]|uniref:Uncharacterized protein n=1 Tax=Dichanthelium oligosanthes TaxID=888268 RepID=A0A1E5UTY9_9POAL|nr:hypothetical protein BAE44_0022700 [Dichanthelium oligosanthes]
MWRMNCYPCGVRERETRREFANGKFSSSSLKLLEPTKTIFDVFLIDNDGEPSYGKDGHIKFLCTITVLPDNSIIPCHLPTLGNISALYWIAQIEWMCHSLSTVRHSTHIELCLLPARRSSERSCLVPCLRLQCHASPYMTLRLQHSKLCFVSCRATTTQTPL